MQRFLLEQRKNVFKLGKNRDGSFTKSFPANTTLYEALFQCGLSPESEKGNADSFVKKFGKVPLGDLTQQQIEEAVMSCQVASW